MRKQDDHYEYIATYVDDLLAYSRDPMAIINKIKEEYILKGISVPEYYLGGNVDRLDEHQHKEGVYVALSAKTCYINNVMDKLEKMMGG